MFALVPLPSPPACSGSVSAAPRSWPSVCIPISSTAPTSLRTPRGGLRASCRHVGDTAWVSAGAQTGQSPREEQELVGGRPRAAGVDPTAGRYSGGRRTAKEPRVLFSLSCPALRPRGLQRQLGHPADPGGRRPVHRAARRRHSRRPQQHLPVHRGQRRHRGRQGPGQGDAVALFLRLGWTLLLPARCYRAGRGEGAVPVGPTNPASPSR